VRGGGQEGE
jgi:hypothetical protein